MMKLVVIFLCTSIILPGYASWYSENVLNSKSGADDIYSSVLSHNSQRILFQETSDAGWCCKDGRVVASRAEECRRRGGTFFRNRKKAEKYCLKKEDKPPEEKMLPKKPEEGWCCKDGRVIASKAEECRRRGGTFFHTFKETEDYCLRKGSKRQRDLELRYNLNIKEKGSGLNLNNAQLYRIIDYTIEIAMRILQSTATKDHIIHSSILNMLNQFENKLKTSQADKRDQLHNTRNKAEQAKDFDWLEGVMPFWEKIIHSLKTLNRSDCRTLEKLLVSFGYTIKEAESILKGLINVFSGQKITDRFTQQAIILVKSMNFSQLKMFIKSIVDL